MKYKIIAALSLLITLSFIISCENETTLEFKRYYSVGAVVYQTHCQNCHGVNGEGLAALVPPLSDSLYLKKNRTALACSIKYGLKGAISINNKSFDDVMPATQLAPMEIAQVLTYIGNSFGNKLGTIDEPQVQADLAKCK
jgi:mono/diheme cytochrome c family protein